MNEFKCRACGKCCIGPGSAFLYPEDIRTISKELSLTIEEFIKKYTDYVLFEVIDGDSFLYMPYLVLKKDEDRCFFLKENRCSIHAFKPHHCKTTPFVSEFFEQDQWREELKKECIALSKMNDKDFNKYKDDHVNLDEIEKEYIKNLHENGYNLEKILNVTLEAPKIIEQESD